jgi:hypothetical protein
MNANYRAYVSTQIIHEPVGAALAANFKQIAAKAAPTVRRFVQIGLRQSGFNSPIGAPSTAELNWTPG